MTPKQIAIITENELDFHVRKAWLISHKVRWITPPPSHDFSIDSPFPDLAIIEGDAEGIKWLEEFRADFQLPVTFISWESQTFLQARLTWRMDAACETSKGKIPILEFGKHGIYYLRKPMRFEQLNMTIEACSTVTDYGDTQQQLILRQAVRRLRCFRHSGWKRLVGFRFCLEVLIDDFSAEAWEELTADSQKLYEEIALPLQQIRNHPGLELEKHFPDLMTFKKKWGILLNRWQRRTDCSPDGLRSDYKRLKEMTQIFTSNQQGKSHEK